MKLYKAIRTTFWIDKKTNTQNHFEAVEIAHKTFGKDKILEIKEV